VSLCLSPSDDRLIVPLATGVLLLEPRPAATKVELDAPWSGVGTGAVTIAGDGTGSSPRFEYHVHGEAGEWTFSAAAGTSRCVWIAWSYAGFHAWLDVRVKLERFVRRGGGEIERETLVKTVPGGRSDVEPSGSFVCSGMSSFDVLEGDIYGFRMSGRNVDF
jgi:hypothetical protein